MYQSFQLQHGRPNTQPYYGPQRIPHQYIMPRRNASPQSFSPYTIQYKPSPHIRLNTQTPVDSLVKPVSRNQLYQSLPLSSSVSYASLPRSTVGPRLDTVRVIEAPAIKVVEQPIQVVELKQYEELWKKKLADIENSFKVEEKVVFRDVYKEDSTRTDQLENQLRLLQQTVRQQSDTLLQKNDQIRVLEETLDQMRQLSGQVGEFKSQMQIMQQQIHERDQEIERLKRENQGLRRDFENIRGQLDNKEFEVQDKEREIEDLLSEIDQMKLEMTETSTQTTYLTAEINTWKNKFIELNREFHQTQEGYMLCQAELENIKKGGIKITQQTTTTSELRSSAQRSGGKAGRQSSYERASNHDSSDK